ncbi:hypothetical protein AB0I84_04600 [Streptomyces spectabilis]|uniref:hypothetical protein n=1 Tax=Streptomyces spectabilis TaxID=68270 RepID=UPI0034116ADD
MEPVEDDGEDSLNADIQEFTTHERKGGWARALLIARRVTPRAGQGKRKDRQPFSDPKKVHRRVSALEFSQRSGVSVQRILALHAAWERAAAAGIVKPAAELTPDVHVSLPDENDVPFFGDNGYYRSYSGNLKKERRQAIEAEAERAGVKPNSTVFVASHPAALKTAVVADATARGAAQDGLDEFNRRQAQPDEEDQAAAHQTAQERARDFEQATAPTAQQDPSAEAAEIEQAMRAAKDKRQPDVALQVFSDMAEVRLTTLRVLSLLQQNSVTFSVERSQVIGELCDATRAAIDFIRDLATSTNTAFNDAALQTFLDESEKLR